MSDLDQAAILSLGNPGAAPRFFSDENKLVIRGLDPIAYFKDRGPAFGVPEHASEYMGFTFYHQNAENRELFLSNPAKYAPQFGGYCAFAMSKGAVAMTVPPAWNIETVKNALPENAVHGELLYLNYSLPVRDAWRADMEGNVKRANGYWPQALVEYGPPRGFF